MPDPVVNPALSRRFLGPGDKLGACALIRQLSVGEVTESYLGRTVGMDSLEELVVVKRVLAPYRDDPRFARTFLEEAGRAATLQHPNVARISEVGEDAGEVFLAMEYIHGEDLRRVIAAGIEQGVGIPLDAALTVVAGACAALNYAHAKAGPDGRPLHVVHRDVAPSNVIVTYDGAVKLVDFGIARARASRSVANLPYSSPEQARDAVSIDRRSDLFSLGVILYELTTGRLPFAGDPRDVLELLATRDVPPPTTIVPGYPPALETIVLRALSRDPALRYRSAVELQSQLEDFAHDHGFRTSPLALSRLLSSLFPQRLEEWDHARTQGAFFVEQHVLRTLAESGKLLEPPPEEPSPPPTKPLRAMSPVLQTAPTAVIAVTPRGGASDGETSIVAIHAASKKSLVALGVAAIAGAAIAIAVVLGSGGAKDVPVAATQPSGSAPSPDVAPLIAPTPAPVDAGLPEPAVAETVADPEPAPPPKKKIVKKTLKKRPLSRRAGKPRPAAEKESGWNDDSPFLPVRPGK